MTQRFNRASDDSVGEVSAIPTRLLAQFENAFHANVICLLKNNQQVEGWRFHREEVLPSDLSPKHGEALDRRTPESGVRSLRIFT